MNKPTVDAGSILECNLREYRILDQIGQGGFAKIYKAIQPDTAQLVAIKILTHHESLPPHIRLQYTARFEYELHICARLNHPYILKLLDKGYLDSGELCGIFEYIPGASLREIIIERNSWSAAKTGTLMGRVLEALYYLHANEIVHRDLKPQHVMIATKGAEQYPVIVDFGISELLSGNAFSDIVFLPSIGTPAYSAPEQLRGERTMPVSDIYSWGLMLLECLTGRRAIQGSSQSEIIRQQLEMPCIFIPAEISGHPIAELLKKVLQKDGCYRLNSADAVLQEYAKIDFNNLPCKAHLYTQQNDSADDITIISDYENP